MVDLDKCDLKGCENSWAVRVNIMDMCQFHYDLWKANEDIDRIEKQYNKCSKCGEITKHQNGELTK